MIEAMVDKDGLILYVKSQTVVKLENMLNGLEYLHNDATLPRDLRILEDATKVEVNFNISDIDILLEKMHEVAQEYNSILHAVIHDSPKNTAFAMIIEQNKVIDNYLLKVFSTEQGALQWLSNR